MTRSGGGRDFECGEQYTGGGSVERTSAKPKTTSQITGMEVMSQNDSSREPICGRGRYGTDPIRVQ